MNRSIFLLAQELGLKLTLGVTPPSSVLSLPPNLYPSHKLSASQSTLTFLSPWSWKRIQWTCRRISFNLLIYMHFSFKTRPTPDTAGQTHIPSVPSPEPCNVVSEYSLNKVQMKESEQCWLGKSTFVATAERLWFKRDVSEAKFRGLNLW